VYAPAGQEEAQVQQAQELAAGDSYDYGNDQTSSGNDVSNPYLGVASDSNYSCFGGSFSLSKCQQPITVWAALWCTIFDKFL
tara:strand:- start:286 stop:531 length:246 start_codon:yes stop_codon:yes gene_type:complete